MGKLSILILALFVAVATFFSGYLAINNQLIISIGTEDSDGVSLISKFSGNIQEVSGFSNEIFKVSNTAGLPVAFLGNNRIAYYSPGDGRVLSATIHTTSAAPDSSALIAKIGVGLTNVSFSPNGQKLAGFNGKKLNLYNLSTNQQENLSVSSGKTIWLDNDILAYLSFGLDQNSWEVRILDTRTMSSKKIFSTRVETPEIYRAGAKIVIASQEKSLKKPLLKISIDSSIEKLNSISPADEIAWSPSGELMATLYNNRFSIVDTKNGETKELTTDSYSVLCNWSTNENHFFCLEKNSIVLWDLSKNQPTKRTIISGEKKLEGCSSLVISPDDRTIILSNPKTDKIYGYSL